MTRAASRASRRAFGRGAALLAIVLLTGCRSEQSAAAIPVGRSDDEIVVVTRNLEAAFVKAPIQAVVSSKKDDGATGWDRRLEEQIDPPENDVSRRRFRITLANRSDKVRTIRVDLDYLSPVTGELLRTRTFRLVVVPPFTEKAISGYTQFRAARSVVTELRAVEVEPE